MSKKKKKTPKFLPPPKRAFLNVFTPQGSDVRKESLYHEGECRSDVTGIITMDRGSEVAVVGSTTGRPVEEKLMRKSVYKNRYEKVFLFAKGLYEIRGEDYVLPFSLDGDGITLDRTLEKED